MKGEATKQLNNENLHPLAKYAKPGNRAPSPWADRKWKVFLDSADATENAIRYVTQNPMKEGKPPQEWSFVTPFTGVPKSWITYH
jgi:hypothetical protein